MSKSKKPDFVPKYLGRHSPNPVETIDRIPWHGGRVTVCLECTEFTSLCPITSQPDFGELSIRYVPSGFIVETKSLKLFLMRYRDVGAFNEALIAEIAETLYRQLVPEWIEVTGRFHSRGGIAVTAQARRPESAPAERK